MPDLSGDRLVRAEKVERYLLDAAHPNGGPKAAFFTSFGFLADDPEALVTALNRHPDRNEVASTSTTEFGVKSVVECNLATPDGRSPCVRTVWALDHGSAVWRLVTAYPKG